MVQSQEVTGSPFDELLQKREVSAQAVRVELRFERYGHKRIVPLRVRTTRIPLTKGSKLVQKPSRALDVREEEGDGAGWKVGPHRLQNHEAAASERPGRPRAL